MNTRNRWIGFLAALSLALAGVLVTAPAGAATTYRIHSVHSCQRFLAAVGADLGTAAPGRCAVASTGGGLQIGVGQSLTVARGWTLSTTGVVVSNEGSITNYGTFQVADDVLNNLGHARFTNYGKVVILRGSVLDVFDDAVFVNKCGARVDAVDLWDGATVINKGTIKVSLLTVADWYDAVLLNFGRIFINSGGSFSGPITGHQPIQLH